MNRTKLDPLVEALSLLRQPVPQKLPAANAVDIGELFVAESRARRRRLRNWLRLLESQMEMEETRPARRRESCARSAGSRRPGRHVCG